MRIAVVNAGSATLKLAMLEGSADALAETFRAETDWRSTDQEKDACALLERLPQPPDAVGHRVVHGGPVTEEIVALDAAVEKVIREFARHAPLHNPPALAGIAAARRLYPAVPRYAAFDTAFHARRPAASRHYALPPALAAELGLYRYGFHGIAHAWLARAAARAEGVDPGALDAVTLQLGAGCSACAVRQGRSIETSMGCTPLEGLVMLTRSGDIDPAVVIELFRGGRDAETVERLLTGESGLFGLTGKRDMREILAAAAARDDAATLALDIFVHRIVLMVGAYLTLLDGKGVLVFSGGIGANAAVIRERIARGLRAWDVHVDPGLNAEAGEGRISAAGRPVYVFRAAEERLIAQGIARRAGEGHSAG
jgi:acetate kinase